MRSFRSLKDLRLFVKKFLKERMKGLPPEFRIEVEALDYKNPRVLIKVPVHSEKNLVRAHQLDVLIKELEDSGVLSELCYIDDLEEMTLCFR